MNQKIVICINREYGSGGRAVGEMLAEDLGVHYYDKEILKLAAEESGINETLFNQADASFTGSLLSRAAAKVYNGDLIPPWSQEFTSEQNLFNYQAKVIKALAKEKSCVIVGRCAGYILKDESNVVNVFVHAPLDFRLERAAEKKSLPPRELEKFVEKENRRRAAYNLAYTGERWDDAHNYDICVDSSKLGVEKCVAIIKGYMKVRFDGLEL